MEKSTWKTPSQGAKLPGLWVETLMEVIYRGEKHANRVQPNGRETDTRTVQCKVLKVSVLFIEGYYVCVVM